MLEKIDLNKKLGNKEYKNEMEGLEQKLTELQFKIREAKIPVLIVFEGWSASGKGTFIGKVLYPLDPRYFNVHTMDKYDEDRAMRPFLWKYWVNTPSKGRISIYDKSWHRIALPEGVEKWKLSLQEKEGFYYDVNSFEQQLGEDGTLILKLFLHISKEEQRRRFEELSKKPGTSWRINEGDWRQNKNYEKYLKHFENMIQQSNAGISKWNIIEAEDKNYATVKIYKVIINRIEEELAARQKTREKSAPLSHELKTSILSGLDLQKEISQNEYKEKLKYYQKKLSDLGFELYAKRRPVVVVYEGWDAAGKGGNIKRLTEELDPRGYEVVPTPAPTAEELAHHYLWRFWNKIPKDGHIAIFDRSWYGRVMVERIEGFCTKEEWQRAYKEINDMEMSLHNHGAVIFKFWLHIDKDEQLARFKDREANPLKRYKITEEDWRNREKWDLYETAVDEMLFRTNTEYAPWVIVESNHKKYARVKVLEHVVKTLEERI